MLFSTEAQKRLNKIAYNSNIKLKFDMDGNLESVDSSNLGYFDVDFNSVSSKFIAALRTPDNTSEDAMDLLDTGLKTEYENLSKFLTEMNQALTREYQYRLNALHDEFLDGNCFYCDASMTKKPVKEFLKHFGESLGKTEEEVLESLDKWIEEQFETMAYNGEFT
jgi:hypothetical protein